MFYCYCYFTWESILCEGTLKENKTTFSTVRRSFTVVAAVVALAVVAAFTLVASVSTTTAAAAELPLQQQRMRLR